jgi:CheY-like chemotaxis protein
MDHQDRILRALVVDDDEQDRNRVSGVLKGEGFVVHEARNGREALERIRKSHFELIVLDILMPYVDGFEVMNHLKKQFPEVLERTVVASCVDLRDLNAFFPACRVIQKPVNTEDLSLIAREIRQENA